MKRFGCYLLVVGFFAAITVASFAATGQLTSNGKGANQGNVMPYLFLALTVLIALALPIISSLSKSGGRPKTSAGTATHTRSTGASSSIRCDPYLVQCG